MPSDKSALETTLYCQVQASAQLLFYHRLLHGLLAAFLVIWALFWWPAVFLGCFVILSYDLGRRRLSLTHACAVQKIWWPAESKQLRWQENSGKYYTGQLTHGLILGWRVVILRIRLNFFKRKTIILYLDSIPKAIHRRLRVRLTTHH